MCDGSLVNLTERSLQPTRTKPTQLTMGQTTVKETQGLTGTNKITFQCDENGTITEITDKDGKEVFKIEHKCDSGHGGEAVTKGGFRGGGEDVPPLSDKKPTPAKTPEPTTKISATPEPKPKGGDCDGCMDTFKNTSEIISGVYEASAKITAENIGAGFKMGRKKCRKKCGPCCNCKEVVHTSTPQASAAKPKSWQNTLFWVLILVCTAAAIYLLCDYLSGNNTSAVKEEAKQTVVNVYNCCPDKTSNGSGDSSQKQGESHVDDPKTKTSVVPTTFGNWNVANPELAIRIWNCLVRDSLNFNQFSENSRLDGENTYVILSGMLSTLRTNNKDVRFLDTGPEIYKATFSDDDDLCSWSIDRAFKSGNYAQYESLYEDKNSHDWWVNIPVEEVTSSNETYFGLAVQGTIGSLNEELLNRKIPSMGGKFHLASLNTTSGLNSSGGGSSNLLSSVYSSVNPLPDYFEFIRGISLTGDVHHGYDLAAPKGQNIHAIKGGVVVDKGYQVNKSGKGWGNYLFVSDGTYMWVYAHMTDRFVTKGDVIRQDQVIGTVGDTGAKGNYHLHIECWKIEEWKKKGSGGKPEKLQQFEQLAGLAMRVRPFAFQKTKTTQKSGFCICARARISTTVAGAFQFFFAKLEK